MICAWSALGGNSGSRGAMATALSGHAATARRGSARRAVSRIVKDHVAPAVPPPRWRPPCNQWTQLYQHEWLKIQAFLSRVVLIFLVGPACQAGPGLARQARPTLK
jgi:hypothetical protein